MHGREGSAPGAYQTLGNGVAWSLNLAMAVLIKRSIEGGIGLSEGLLLGAWGDGASGTMGFEDFGKLSFDVLIISFRLQQRECLPAARPNYLQCIALIDNAETDSLAKASVDLL